MKKKIDYPSAQMTTMEEREAFQSQAQHEKNQPGSEHSPITPPYDIHEVFLIGTVYCPAIVLASVLVKRAFRGFPMRSTIAVVRQREHFPSNFARPCTPLQIRSASIVPEWRGFFFRLS